MAMLRRLLSIVVFALLQVLLLPLAVVGMLWVAWKQIGVSRRLGVSQTGIEIINGRWTAHVFGLRDDPLSAALAAVLPNTSTTGLWLVLFPLWVQQRLSGRPLGYPRVPPAGEEGIADLVPARSVAIDGILDRVLGGDDQFVVLGGGYDSRAVGAFGQRAQAVFEVDQAQTQALKLQGLQEAGIDTDGVVFLTVDFTRDDLFERLREHGWDAARRSVFLWEGVTLYLGEDDVIATMAAIRDTAAPGSVLVLDLYGGRMLRMGGSGAMRKSLEATDEGLRFGLDLSADPAASVTAFLAGAGYACGEAHYLGAQHAEGAYAAVVEALPQPEPTDG